MVLNNQFFCLVTSATMSQRLYSKWSEVLYPCICNTEWATKKYPGSVD